MLSGQRYASSFNPTLAGADQRAWVSAPASTKSTDGLGPLYNAPWIAQQSVEDDDGLPLGDGVALRELRPADGAGLELGGHVRERDAGEVDQAGLDAVLGQDRRGQQVQDVPRRVDGDRRRRARAHSGTRVCPDRRPQVDLGQNALLDQPAVDLVVRLFDAAEVMSGNPAALQLPFVADIVRENLGVALTTPTSTDPAQVAGAVDRIRQVTAPRRRRGSPCCR